jgi:hypothetical protein
VFQSGPFSRPEAGWELQGIFKSLKMCGLRQQSFGTRPAFENPGSRNKLKIERFDGPTHAASTEGAGAEFLCQSIEKNSEFEEIPADDRQRSGEPTIRRMVPTKSSSTANPQTTSQKPLERRVSHPTRNAALIPSETKQRATIAEIRSAREKWQTRRRWLVPS